MISENERPSEKFRSGNWAGQHLSAPMDNSARGGAREGWSCQKCGEVREFKNSKDYEFEWTNPREMARLKASSPIDSFKEAEDLVQVDRLMPSSRTRSPKSPKCSNLGRKSQSS